MINSALPEHHAFHLKGSPGDWGHQVMARPRVWSIMYHKDKAEVLHNPEDVYQNLCRATRKAVGYMPLSLFFAATPEVLETENSMRKKRGLPPVLRPSANWQSLLTDAEPRQGHV